MLTQVQQNQWLFKADLLRVFSACFSYPNEQTIQDIRHLSAELQTNTTLLPEIQNLLEFLPKYLRPTHLEKEYSELFIQGGVPLSETAYNPSIDIYSELAAYYQAFGVQPTSGDAPDTLPYELEFLGVLCIKIALAKTTEQREVSYNAYRTFIQTHLFPLVNKLHQRLTNNFPNATYTWVTEFLKQFLHRENSIGHLN